MPKVSSANAQVEDHGVVFDRHGEVVQFSPTKELKETSEVIMKNMQEMQGG